MMITVDSVVVC